MSKFISPDNARVAEAIIAHQAFQGQFSTLVTKRNQQLSVEQRINTKEYLHATSPYTFLLQDIFKGQLLDNFIIPILNKRGFTGLYNFFETAYRLKEKNAIEELSRIYLHDTPLPAQWDGLPKGVSYMLGRSQIVPLVTTLCRYLSILGEKIRARARNCLKGSWDGLKH